MLPSATHRTPLGFLRAVFIDAVPSFDNRLELMLFLRSIIKLNRQVQRQLLRHLTEVRGNNLAAQPRANQPTATTHLPTRHSAMTDLLRSQVSEVRTSHHIGREPVHAVSDSGVQCVFGLDLAAVDFTTSFRSG